MKKILLSLFLGFSFILILSAFSKPNSIIQQEEKFTKAYINSGNVWCEGYIYYFQTSNGYKLTRYSFNANGSTIQGYFNGAEKFVSLNPNSELAKAYNFTSYVNFIESSGRNTYRAYINR
jgi:hypothetical protein